MAMFGVSAAAGAIFKVATGTKRAIDFLQSFNGVEEEGYVLWKTLEALTVPVQVAEKLVVREEATGLLLPSTCSLVFFPIGDERCDFIRPQQLESMCKNISNREKSSQV